MKSELLTPQRGRENCDYIASLGICVCAGLIFPLTWGMMWSTDDLEITTCSTCLHGRKEKSHTPLSISISPYCIYTEGHYPPSSHLLSLFVFLCVRLAVDWQLDGVKYNSEKTWDLTVPTFDASLSTIFARGSNKQQTLSPRPGNRANI